VWVTQQEPCKSETMSGWPAQSADFATGSDAPLIGETLGTQQCLCSSLSAGLAHTDPDACSWCMPAPTCLKLVRGGRQMVAAADANLG